MKDKRVYREFVYKEAVFRICCHQFEAVCEEIIRQRQILEEYIQFHPDFQTSLQPIDLIEGAPQTAVRMAAAAKLVGVGPMAAVAGIMAEFAARAGMRAGAHEAIVENGGDIYIATSDDVVIGLYPGGGKLAGKLGFSLSGNDTPIAICSSSGKMGHSMSLGDCDLATVVAADAALADAAATMAANMVKTADDVDAALNKINAIEGIDGVLIVKDERVGLVGRLPELVRVG